MPWFYGTFDAQYVKYDSIKAYLWGYDLFVLVLYENRSWW